MLNQKLQQKLQQKLSPQQIQLMKLLQVPTVALEQRIKQEIEDNPALEESVDDNNQDDSLSLNENEDNQSDDQQEDQQDDDFDIQDYFEDDYVPDYKTYANNKSADDDHDRREMPIASSLSFHEQLQSQLGLRKLTPEQYQIGCFIIGSIDDSGYLTRDFNSLVDDLAFNQNIITNPKEIEKLVKVIQEFDPPGICAKNLQECLLIQLKRIEKPSGSVKHAIRIIERYFNEFTKKHYDKISGKMGISETELKNAYSEILKLNPKPGNILLETSKIVQYIIPDFIVNNDNGKLELTVNSRNAPELRLNQTYQKMMENLSHDKKKLKTSDKDLIIFVKQKLDSAKWFIEMIKQRYNTLHNTMKAIMDFQSEYFVSGDETKIKPMILKDISEIVNLDISTVSRVANSKYVQTPYGTFLLKSFFSESLQTDSGEEVSTREVKKILTDCIAAEDKRKPVTDEQLMKILNNKGYNIARRTVAKYREQLEIPVARLRKEL